VKDKVVGRDIDLSRFAPQSAGAIEGGAPDLVDQATDKAARELGWTSPEAARAFFASNDVKSMRVAVALPAAPTWHSAKMDLRVEIDRGDVYYDGPGAAERAKQAGTFKGPTFVVYAKDGDHDVALMRWATTIGGWKKERTEDGEIVFKYKESDVGDRVWRQLIAAPAWLPPDSTPETDLVYEGKDGTATLKKSLMQPGYLNAYGLAMLIHDEPISHGAKTTWRDHGIRTHGSVDYRSIQNGTSHGCHRLYNQLVLRLTGFLLEHRSFETKGKMRAGYQRTIEWNDQTIDVDIPNRGYLYELDPPVPVRVLEGHIAGASPDAVSSVIHIEPDHTAEPKIATPASI
jgi:lipoprotein-anchoring transpeptidase ErfK/SrfK